MALRVHEIDHDLPASNQVVIKPDLLVFMRPEQGIREAPNAR
jgi:hypothetical protein